MVYNRYGIIYLLTSLHMNRARKIILLLLCCILILACNLPLNPGGAWPGSYPTLDPNIFNVRTQTPSVTPVIATPTASPTPLPVNPNQEISYYAQSGDTLKAVAAHYEVAPDQITSPAVIPAAGLIPAGQQLIIPLTAGNSVQGPLILPDSAVVYSPCANGFDVGAYVASAGGYLNYHTQLVYEDRVSGADVVARTALNASVDPRLLLAFIEFRSGWVRNYVTSPNTTYPLGLNTQYYEGLFRELGLVTQGINAGYYAWRQGQISRITFADGRSADMAPNLNAGSVGILYLFAQLYPLGEVDAKLYGEGGFLSVYQSMFGDPLICAASVEPLFTQNMKLPALELPFAPGERWSLTGGLHADWVTGTPLGALDFAPITGETACSVSRAWVLASAAGVVTRSSNSVVLVALEDESGQPTGWELMYMHVAEKDRVPLGTHLRLDDRIGHPSCEGGPATGTHVHITRKFRGEWIGANDTFPFVLSGWQAFPGEAIYKGGLVKGEMVVTARSMGSRDSVIVR